MRVLIASPDRHLLRHLAWLLASFGYDVRTIADERVTTARLSFLRPDIFILDQAHPSAVRDALDADQHRDAPFCYKLLLYDEGADLDVADLDVAELVAAGFDDFLRKPVSHVEVLSRLRAAARAIEYEHRLETVQHRDVSTGFLTRRSLLAMLDVQREARRSARTPTSLVVVESDALEPFRATFGWQAAQSQWTRLADVLRSCCDADQVPASLDEDRFAVVLPNQGVDSARSWSDRLREQFTANSANGANGDGEATSETGLTISCAIAELTGASDAAGALDDALDSLCFARDNGGDCSVGVDEFAAERQAWLRSFSGGNPFAGSTARDLMTPFTLRLAATDTLSEAAARFRRTRLEVLPVYDMDGSFLGHVREEECEESAKAAMETATTVSALVTTDVIRIDGDADISAVMEHFFGLNDQPLVVVCDGEPRGTVSHRSFAALVRPVTSRTFSASHDDSQSPLTRLIIPDTLEGDDVPPEDAVDDSAINRFSQRIQTLGLAAAPGERR